MSRRNFGALALAGLALAGCHREETPRAESHPHYVLGAAWKGRSGWFYPREDFSYRATGIATIDTNPASGVTADGEVWSATGMTGAHQTLQLPAIVSVRNLLNGRTVRIRLNARGPVSAGRVVALSAKAADLLEMRGDTPVEVIEDEAVSHALAEAMGEVPAVSVQKAPVGEVQAESLSDGSRQTFGNAAGPGAGPTQALTPLPAVVQQGMGGPSGLYVLLGMFSGHGAALQVAARCGGQVARVYDASGLDWKVRLGPYGDVAQADMALDRTPSCGVDGARIVVE